MKKIQRDQLYDQAKAWVLEAGKNIREKMTGTFEIASKSNPNDLVTEIDKNTEEFFVQRIKETFPNHGIIGEEGYGDKLTSLDGIVWIIDPIDGTMNFVHQKRNFAISVGIYKDGVGEIGIIYDVMANNLYHAKRSEGAYKNARKLAPLKMNPILSEAIIGMNHFWLCENRHVDEKVMQQFVRTIRGARTYGSAALEFAFLAEGIIDGYISMKLSPWDIAAGKVIAEEVGGLVTTIDGEELTMLDKSTVLACNRQLHHDIASFIKKGRK